MQERVKHFSINYRRHNPHLKVRKQCKKCKEFFDTAYAPAILKPMLKKGTCYGCTYEN